MRDIKFGDIVLFDKEYISCKPKTVDIKSNVKDTEEFLTQKNIELLDNIKCKKIHTFKKQKAGVYLGNTMINMSFYYDFYEGAYTEFGKEPDRYMAYKSEYIEIAEIRCENIKKTYYVPIENLIKGE